MCSVFLVHSSVAHAAGTECPCGCARSPMHANLALIVTGLIVTGLIVPNLALIVPNLALIVTGLIVTGAALRWMGRGPA